MAKQYTIKRIKPGSPPKFVRPKRTNIPPMTTFRKILLILLVVLIMAGVGVGIWVLVSKLQENFGCQSCQQNKETDTKNE